MTVAILINTRLAPYLNSTLSCRSRLHFIIHFIIKLIAFGKIFH